jgi:hypothetical protein
MEDAVIQDHAYLLVPLMNGRISSSAFLPLHHRLVVMIVVVMMVIVVMMVVVAMMVMVVRVYCHDDLSL